MWKSSVQEMNIYKHQTMNRQEILNEVGIFFFVDEVADQSHKIGIFSFSIRKL